MINSRELKATYLTAAWVGPTKGKATMSQSWWLSG